jgi:ATP-dependent DNA helicase PIF1
MTQAEALDILKMGKNVFLTGAAGSGKTYVLNAFISWLRDNGVGTAVTASTGIAATHIGGMTIHAWSGLGVRDSVSPEELETLESRQYLWKRYEKTQVLIIDEVSMLHHFRFDLLDRMARAFKRNEAPFGGMQVVLCGDFFQLPPIARFGEPDALFAYRSNVWNDLDLQICYLEEQHRQSDDAFLSVLGAIRTGEIGEDVLEHLRGRYKKDIDLDVEPTRLSTHNENVDAINDAELGKIAGERRSFAMTSRGSRTLVETLKKSCLAPSTLALAEGARVMFVKNNYEKNFVNGTLGVVEGFDDAGWPIVRTAQGETIIAEPESWRVEEDGSAKAEIAQVPLRLAWAITIHKSQGMSLDAAEVDLSRSFAPGMGYVALSRVRSLAGLKLMGFNHRALAIHPEVLEKDAEFKEASREAAERLADLGAEEVVRRQSEYATAYGKKISAKKEKEEELPSHHQTKMLIIERKTLAEIAEARGMKEDTIVAHIERLQEEGERVDISHLRPMHIDDQEFERIQEAFAESRKQHGDLRLAPVRSALARDGRSMSYSELRLVRLFLDFKA